MIEDRSGLPSAIQPAERGPAMATTTETAESTHTTRHRRRAAAFVALFAVLGAVLSLVLGPDPRLGDQRTGEPKLVADVAAVVGEGRGITALSTARLEGGATSFAGFGEVDGAPPTPDTPFELGSITKVFTGQLLADAVRRGEMTLDDPVQRHLPELAGTPAGAATLKQLATHTSGMPRLPEEMGSLRSALAPTDPYADWSPRRVIDAARTAELDPAGQRQYSNFGMALLGIAQARAAGADSWPRLVTERLFRPLGMTHTRIITAGSAEPTGLASPRWDNGRHAVPWTSDGFAAAGGATRTTARDLARFASAVLDGSAPGASAVQQVTGSGERRSGLAWIIESEPAVTWHNGGTGGTSTMLALDPQAGRAGIALATTDRSVDDLGIALATDRTDPMANPLDRVGLVALVAAAAALLVLLVRLIRRPTRVGLASGVIDAGLGAALLLLIGPWGWAPGWTLGALLGALAAAVLLALAAARRAPTAPVKGRATAWISLVLSVVLVAAMAYLLT